jgi:CRP/FNR family transcriptional regulator
MAHTLPSVCFRSLIKIKHEALGKHNNASALEINQDDDLSSHFPPKIRPPRCAGGESVEESRMNATIPIKIEPLKVACSSCNLRELCLPVGLSSGDLEQLDKLVATRRQVARGDTLFRSGDSFLSLYAVRTGFFKTCVTSEDGRDQVTGFQMAGELLGLDGISTDRHSCDAVALEDSQVCVIPYEQLEELSREFTDLQRQFHKIMSREIVRDHGVMLLLGSMRAEERLAAFLLNLTQRLQARGFSAAALVLRMTREEIGSYLGLKLETVSRTFSKFQDDGLLEVKQRQLRILDQAGLQRLVNSSNC